MQHPRAERIRQELIRLSHAGLDSRTLYSEMMKRLKTVVPIDVSFFSTTDPATLLFTGAVVDELILSAYPRFMENEFLQDDVNKFSWLVRTNTSVVNLMQATQGKLEQSQRYREILAPLALGDELRAALCRGLAQSAAVEEYSRSERAGRARITPARRGSLDNSYLDTRRAVAC